MTLKHILYLQFIGTDPQSLQVIWGINKDCSILQKTIILSKQIILFVLSY